MALVKYCPGCEEEKPLEDFGLINKRGQQKPGARCKLCRRKQSSDSYKKHREKRLVSMRQKYHDNLEERREYGRRYREDNKDALAKLRQSKVKESTYSSWVRRLKQKGLTPDDYLDMLSNQNGCCAICEATEPGQKPGSSWVVDHCHTTGKVRGLLCHACNMALGLFKDNTSILGVAINYLLRSRGEL